MNNTPTMLNKKQINHVQNILRRASYKCVGRIQAKNEAKRYVDTFKKDKTLSKKKGVRFVCAHCNGLFKNSQVQMDHIEPVIDPTTGFVNAEDFYLRLFVSKSGWQCLCKDCHAKKSAKENKVRQKRGRKKKR